MNKWDGICPLIFTKFTKPWSTCVYAVDASEWGLGVVSSSFSADEVQQLGMFSERWRYKDNRAKDPRSFVLSEDYRLFHQGTVGDEPQPCAAEQQPLEAGHPGGFETVGFGAVERQWKVFGRHKWDKRETMPVYEARATLYAVKHCLRNLSNHGLRHVILTDSLTAAVAFTKGRAHSYKLRGVVEQASALMLATGSHSRSRWIPSEWNPSDNISRGGFVPSTPCRFFGDDTQTTGGEGHLDKSKEEPGAPQPKWGNNSGKTLRSSCTPRCP